MKAFRTVVAAVVLVAAGIVWDGAAGAASKVEYASGPIVMKDNTEFWVFAHNRTSKTQTVEVDVIGDNGVEEGPVAAIDQPINIASNDRSGFKYECDLLVGCGYSVIVRTNSTNVIPAVTLWPDGASEQLAVAAGDWKIKKKR